MALHFLNPIFIYSRLREKSYSSGLLKKVKLNAPVLSIGNLQFGGSGKTPFVLFLLNHFAGKKIAVVSQSYKAQLSQPELVNLNVPGFFRHYGDEPSMIKSRYPQVDVWCGPVKWETAVKADEHKKYDLIIVDDGFTHHKLSRDLDIVLIDGSRPFSSFRLPPNGRLREPLAALSRSDLVFITKVKSINENKALFEAVRQTGVEFAVLNYETDTAEVKMNSSYLLYAGIGNFEFLKKNALDQIIQVSQFQQFENHCEYSEDKQQRLLADLEKYNLRGLTTTKDKIKLTNPELIKKTDLVRKLWTMDNLFKHFLQK